MPRRLNPPPRVETPARSTRARGQAGEEAAAHYLHDNGYRLVERNWRPGNALRGEVDCIAWNGKTLCFVEVKTRASNDRGHPQEAVTLAKQRQLSRLANAYVSLHRLHDVPCRFDVVEVWMAGTNGGKPPREQPRFALHQNAFDYLDSDRNSYGRIRGL